jgi:hypothetical protein
MLPKIRLFYTGYWKTFLEAMSGMPLKLLGASTPPGMN